MKTGNTKLLLAMFVSSFLIWFAPSLALAQKPTGENAVNGGLGFQVGLTQWAPGGFKWFNGYSREMTERLWLNAQVNVTLGNMKDDRCWYDEARDRWRCEDGRWDGNSLQFALGVRLRWELKKVPVVIDCILGGATDLFWFGHEYEGVAIGFRGGAGVHYFIFDNLGFGPAVLFVLGPAFTQRYGLELYGEFDLQVIGVEFRF